MMMTTMMMMMMMMKQEDTAEGTCKNKIHVLTIVQCKTDVYDDNDVLLFQQECTVEIHCINNLKMVQPGSKE